MRISPVVQNGKEYLGPVKDWLKQIQSWNAAECTNILQAKVKFIIQYYETHKTVEEEDEPVKFVKFFNLAGKLLKYRLSLPDFHGSHCMLQRLTIIFLNVRENVDINKTKVKCFKLILFI